jgi:tRNA threonylcarbamoyladenosine biosynthesis protein TsaB
MENHIQRNCRRRAFIRWTIDVFIEASLKVAGIVYKDLSAIAGVRSDLLWLCTVFLLQRSVSYRYSLVVQILENIGSSVIHFQRLIIPMIDARRMEVYSDIYCWIRKVKGKPKEIITENSFEELEEWFILLRLRWESATVLDKRKFYFEIKFSAQTKWSLVRKV